MNQERAIQPQNAQKKKELRRIGFHLFGAKSDFYIPIVLCLLYLFVVINYRVSMI